MRNKVERFVDLLRNAHPDNEEMYMRGQCYNFSLILRELNPGARIYYSAMEGHVYTEIDGYFYDIRGKHLTVPDDLELLDHRRGDKPHRWGSRDRRKLK